MEYFGIDVGNYHTKSPNTIITSGYEGPFTSKPTISQKYLKFEGMYYIPSTKILSYQKDKTTNERAIILTLMSIAEELIHKASKVKKNTPPKSHQQIQETINKYSSTPAALGVGLPPTHYTATAVKKNIEYYMGYMKDGIHFIYNDYDFYIKLKACRVYPQAGSAAACVNDITSYSVFYVVDIGGYTVDTICFENGTPAGNISSKEMGVLTLYTNIIDRCTIEHDITIDARLIESVLKQEKNILSDEIKNTIFSMTKEHADNIVNTLKESGIELKAYPCLFIGGGSLLLKSYIETHPLINQNGIQFVNDTKLNAIGYSKFLKQDLKSSSNRS